MVHVKDEGSHFEAPVEVVWAFLQDPEAHGRSHPRSRNAQMKPLSETSFILAREEEMNGHWIKTTSRITVFPPLGMSIEVLDGPLAGTKMVNVYTPRGSRTGVDVYGEFVSKEIPAAQLEGLARMYLEQAFNDDAPAIKALSSKH